MSKTIEEKVKRFYPKCDWRYCRNNGMLFPILVLPAPSYTNQKAIEMEMNLNVCIEHAKEDHIEYFLEDAGWEQIKNALAIRKLAAPERKDVKVIFRALEDRRLEA
jgi:hypothetical protein